MHNIGEFLIWLLSTSGPTLAVLTLLGFVFREKWKQLLTRSLTVELERLKHQLQLEQAVHAAGLTPMLESVKHDFQRQLEAYKVTLIAQAEEVKIRGDLKKTIATRYVEVQFERFLKVEAALAKTSGLILNEVLYPPHLRRVEQLTGILESLAEVNVRFNECEMFLSTEERLLSVNYLKTLADFLDHCGPGKDPIARESAVWREAVRERISVENMIRNRIHVMAEIANANPAVTPKITEAV